MRGGNKHNDCRRMGAGFSDVMAYHTKLQGIPRSIDSNKQRHFLSWKPNRVAHPAPESGGCTLGTNVIHKAANILSAYLVQSPSTLYHSWNVLEVFAGNGSASCILQQAFAQVEWTATDLCEYTNTKMEVLRCDALTAVELFGSQANMLVLVSPPPYSPVSHSGPNDDLGFADYFAIREFLSLQKEQKPQKTKWILFLGELGASDGSTGMCAAICASTCLC